MPSRIWILGVAAVALTIWNGAAQASEGGEPAPVPYLVDLQPLRIPIVEHGEVIGRLEVRAMWQAADEAEGATADRRLPQLQIGRAHV